MCEGENCRLTKEDVINIVNEYTQKYFNTYITENTIDCAATICDTVQDLVNSPYTFNISDGVNPAIQIDNGELVRLLESATSIIKVENTGLNDFTFSLNTTGATDNQVLTYNAVTGIPEWKNAVSGGDVNVGNTIIVSKLGNDTTGERESFSRHFLTLNEAIKVAEDNDTIIMYPGTYTETNTNINTLNGLVANISIKMVGEVILNTFIECINKNLKIVGESSTLNGLTNNALHFTGSGVESLYINLDTVTCNNTGGTIYINDINRSYLNINFLNNLKPNTTGGSPLTLVIIDCDFSKYIGESNYLASSSVSNFGIQYQNVLESTTQIDILTSASKANSIAVSQSDNTVIDNHTFSIREAYIGNDAIQISNATVTLDINRIFLATGADSGLKLTGTNPANPTKVLLKNCEMVGNSGAATTNITSTSSLITIGQADTPNDYVKLKVKDSSLTNLNPSVVAPCIFCLGTCLVDSNSEIFLQSCNLFTNGTYPLEGHYYAFGTCDQTNNVPVYLLTSVTSNKTLSDGGSPYYNYEPVGLGNLTINANFVEF